MPDYRAAIDSMPHNEPRITCPRCGMTSYNSNDIREGWCGNCNTQTSPGVASGVRRMTPEEQRFAEIQHIDNLMTSIEARITALQKRLDKLEKTVTAGLHADSAGYVHISYGYELNRD